MPFPTAEPPVKKERKAHVKVSPRTQVSEQPKPVNVSSESTGVIQQQLTQLPYKATQEEIIEPPYKQAPSTAAANTKAYAGVRPKVTAPCLSGQYTTVFLPKRITHEDVERMIAEDPLLRRT